MIEAHARVMVSVDEQNLGVWTTKSGGAVEIEDTKHRPGGLEPQIALGGLQSVENVTVSKLYDAEMASGLFSKLYASMGKPMSVTYQPINADKTNKGNAVTYEGILGRVAPPDADANSSDVAMLELELFAHGTVKA